MHPSSTSSSSQGSMGSSSGAAGLIRYSSAPSSFLTTAVDSISGATREFAPLGTQTHLYFPSETFESTAMTNQNDSVSRRNREEPVKANTRIGLQPSYGFPGDGGGSSSLVRHSSSPAGFLNHLATAAAAADRNARFSITRGIESYNSKERAAEAGGSISRLNTQLSFTGKETLSRIYEENEDVSPGATIAIDNGHKKSTHSYAATTSGAFGGSWENANPIIFSAAQPSRAKNNVVDSLEAMESQFGFSISQTTQDMASMEKLINIPQDSVTCKIRAKRGCATHPRSIAERERRTRISGKLKKLQDLVPNMDKQTSYSDMLDLAVQHIKCLQNQVQNLHNEIEGCTCGGCKKSKDSS